VDERLLRRLAAEVDEDHWLSSEDAPAELVDPLRREGRRGFVRSLAAGAAAVGAGLLAVPALAGAAAAQDATTTTAASSGPTTGTTTTTGVPATTTTLPPAQPTTDDKVTLGFIQSLELGLVSLYQTAIATLKLTPANIEIVNAFGDHHRQHGQIMAAMAGKAALGVANRTFVQKYGPQIQAATDEKGVLQICFQLETAAAASYVSVLGQIVGTDASARLASIAPIESRHAVVFGEALGLDLRAYQPAFEDVSLAVSPFDYPVS
jgi:hypothetical protein